jgi:hypothetical protein
MNIILHVGQHKTGSKFLQSALYSNSAYLINQGINYPISRQGAVHLRPHEMNHHLLFFALRAVVDSRGDRPSLDRFQAMLNFLITKNSPNIKTVVLSAEDLFDMHTAHEIEFIPDRISSGSQLLAAELKKRDIKLKLVCYVRRQDHLLAAHYAQFIKGTTSSLSIDDFYQVFKPRLDTNAILKIWESAFGSEMISVIPYEAHNAREDLTDNFFRQVLRVTPPTATNEYIDNMEAVNRSPSRDHLEYMRILNKKHRRGKFVLPREHVLESAFRDRQISRHGIASWLSSAERICLLGHYEAGNQRIASLYKLEEGLFQEDPPATDIFWAPYHGLSLKDLIRIDSEARNIATAIDKDKGFAKKYTSANGCVKPLVVWVLSKHLDAQTEFIAQEVLDEFIGHPGFNSVLLDEFDPKSTERFRGQAALYILIGVEKKLFAQAFSEAEMNSLIELKQPNTAWFFICKLLGYLGIPGVRFSSRQIRQMRKRLAL